MGELESWFVVRQENGQCTILPANQIGMQPDRDLPDSEKWGPYPSQQEAIARRVGLIRAGKCSPA